MTLVCNGKPLTNAGVRIKRVNVPSTSATSYTDSAGNICGIVPRDEPLVLEVVDGCGNVIYTQNIGPLSANTSLGVITVNPPPGYMTTVTGNAVNCNNLPVASGSVLLLLSNGTYHQGTITNGSFAMQVLNCNGAISYTALAIDNATQLQGSPVNGSGNAGTINTGTLIACGTNAQQFIHVTIDNNTYNWAPPSDSITIFSAAPLAGLFDRGFYIGFSNSFTGNNGYLVVHFDGVGPGRVTFGGLGIPAQQLSTQNVSLGEPTNITEAGPSVTGFFAGNFDIMMRFASGDKRVTGSFRVRHP